MGVHPRGDLPLGRLEAPYRRAEVTGKGRVATAVLTIRNAGAKPMDWAANSTDSWITVSPSNGTLTNENSEVALTITVNPAGLAVGDHPGAVMVEGRDTQMKLGVTLHNLKANKE